MGLFQPHGRYSRGDGKTDLMDFTQGAGHHLGLVHVKDRGMRIVVEIDRHVRTVGITQNAFQRAVSCGADGTVDLFDRCITRRLKR